MKKLLELVRATPNRGKFHIFLGHPLSDGCDKTTVEPGNGYSPGVWTCGVSLWWQIEGNWLTPDRLAEEDLVWKLTGAPGNGNPPGGAPLVESEYRVGPLAVRHRLAHGGGPGCEGVDFNQVEATATAPAGRVRVGIVVREMGPAGGQIQRMDWDEPSHTLRINESLLLTVENSVTECTLIPAQEGQTPAAVLELDLDFSTGPNPRQGFSFKTIHGFGGRTFAEQAKRRLNLEKITVAEGLSAAQADWTRALPARVFCPDPRVARVWERCAFHIQAAMECGLPRIGAVNYPVFWMRDGVIVLRALDLMGRADLARLGNDYLAPLYFAGGFGAETDAPGEGIWSLVRHARITRDRDWLAAVFPTIIRRVGWIKDMIRAEQPLRALTENRIPQYQHTPGVNIVCLPAVNGCIHGRMDWHTPDFFINCWALAGLRLAAETAQDLGQDHLASDWRSVEADLEQAVVRHLLPHYGNPRDPIITPYPSGALAGQGPTLREQFARWYRENRINADGTRRSEPLWTYFEAAQIHNAFLLGLREEAWVNLNGMLADGPWEVSAYGEGKPEGNERLPFANGAGACGWLNPKTALFGNMPHNWTSAEMINLIRDLLVVEEDGGLTLGRGVPSGWLRPGGVFGVQDLPTDLGPVSYRAQIDSDGRVNIDYQGPQPYRLGFPHGSP